MTKKAWLTAENIGTPDAQGDIVGMSADKMTTDSVGPYNAAYLAQTRMHIF